MFSGHQIDRTKLKAKQADCKIICETYQGQGSKHRCESHGEIFQLLVCRTLPEPVLDKLHGDDVVSADDGTITRAHDCCQRRTACNHSNKLGKATLQSPNNHLWLVTLDRIAWHTQDEMNWPSRVKGMQITYLINKFACNLWECRRNAFVFEASWFVFTRLFLQTCTTNL